MRTVYRATVLAISLAASCAMAQATGAKPDAAGGNPFARGDKGSFYYGTINAPLNNGQNQGFAHPMPRVGSVTPVPEPSEWALMLAGLALVGWIVRRSSKRD
jgi:hypothetical protein